MMDLNEAVEQILRTANIVEIAGRYLNLKKSGKNYSALCPFHADTKTPSLSISAEKNLFHCFGCGASGTVITFVEKLDNISRIDAIKKLARELGIEISGGSRRAENERFLKISELAARFFHQNLLKACKDDTRLISFITKRKLTDEAINRFRLGYIPFDAEPFIKECRAQDLEEKTAEDLNIVGYSQEGKPYFKLNSRFVFPIFDLNGYVIAFGARTIDNKANVPKYINSSNSPIYNKGKMLYGLNFSKEYIKKEKSAVLVEGYFDFLALFENGIRNIAASSGTALTEDQAYVIKRFTNTVNILLDSDEAGEKAAFKAIEILFRFGINGKVFRLPEKDPDEFIAKHGAEKMRSFMLANGSPTWAVFFHEYLKKTHDFSDKRSKEEAYRASLSVLKKMVSNDDKNEFLDSMTFYFGYKLPFILEDYQKFSEIRYEKKEKESEKEKEPDHKRKFNDAFSRFLSYTVCHFDACRDEFRNMNTEFLVMHEHYNLVVSLKDFIELGNDNVGAFVFFLEENGGSDFIPALTGYMLESEQKSEEGGTKVLDTFRRFGKLANIFGITYELSEIKAKKTTGEAGLFERMAYLNDNMQNLLKNIGGNIDG